MSVSQRKYHAAAGFSRQQRLRLDRLEEHVSILDQELARVEAMIHERFPALGLAEQPAENLTLNSSTSDEASTSQVPSRRRRRKPR